MRELIFGLAACAVLSAQPTLTQTATSIRGVPINRPNQNAAVPYFSTAVNRILWGTLAELGPVSGASWSGTVDIASIAAGGKGCGTFTATGATTGTALAPLWPALDAGLVGGTIRVSASNTIEVCLINATASPIDPSPATFGAAAQGGVSNSIAWGGITGTLSNQADLQSALDGKQAVDTDLTALAGLSSTGLIARTGAGTAAVRSVAGTTNEITVSNGDGVSGNPTLSLASTFDISGKTSTKPAKTVTALPATCSVGEIAFKTDATAGQNLFGCTATNSWTLQGDGGSGSVSWGSITGTLSSQTDLQSALDAKAAASHNHAASEITSGTIATARLGSGTADSTTFLRGDNTWATPSGSLPSMTGKSLYALKVNSGETAAEWILDSPGAGMSKTRVGSTDFWAVDSTQVPYLALNNAFLGDNSFAGLVNFSGASAVRLKTGTTAPATCTVGDTFFDTDATAGQNLFGCTSTNTWTILGDGTGSGSFGETSLATLATNQVLWDSTNASRTLTAGLSGTNDPVITFSDNLINITTGALQVGGSAVVTTASGNAPTATALASNPTDCSANQFANAIAANGNLTCAAIADADVPDTITASNYLPLTGGTITGDLTVNGSLTVGDGTVAGELQMNELTANGTNYRSWTVPDALTASLTMRFPDTLPSGGEVLTFGAPSGGVSTMAFQSVSSANTASAIVARDSSGNFSAGTITAALSGNATTASALAANGSNCSAGQFPLGVDASGASESCTALPTSISGTANEISASASTGSITLSIPSTLDLGGKSVEIPNGTSLPGTCTVGQIFLDTDATLGQQLYACTSTNTWTVQGDGTGSGSFGETSLATLVNNQTLWDSSSASRTLTAGLSGANDPVITFSDGTINVSAGALQVGGAAVLAPATGSAVGQVLRMTAVSPATYGFGAVDLADTDAITGTLAAAQFPALTGDVTTSAGSLSTTIASGAVTPAKASGDLKRIALGVAVGDPAGSALSTGVLGYIFAPKACTITSWAIAVDAGTATVDVWKVATGTSIPTVANTITASAKPAISTGTAIRSTTLTGWTTSVAAYDVIGFNLDAVSTAKFINITLFCE